MNHVIQIWEIVAHVLEVCLSLAYLCVQRCRDVTKGVINCEILQINILRNEQISSTLQGIN